MASTNRDIRQRFRLKYSKHGKFNWDKWIEYDCIFASYIDSDRSQQAQIELHSKNNIQEPNGKVIDLKKLRSLTSVHGDINKNEPKNIMILKINGKKHRFGFDNIYEFNQWKILLDGVYNSVWDTINKDRPEENPVVNILYESATAKRYQVHFADLATQEILSLPSGPCELIIDTDKLVIEQRQDRQYLFPRSIIRTLRLINDSDVEFELGSRAPVQGLIRFRFESYEDARSCYLYWHEGITTRRIPADREYPKIPQRVQVAQQNSYITSRLPRSRSTRSSYYNADASVSSIPNELSNNYISFQTLV